jgi:hypothetical protein
LGNQNNVYENFRVGITWGLIYCGWLDSINVGFGMAVYGTDN